MFVTEEETEALISRITVASEDDRTLCVHMVTPTNQYALFNLLHLYCADTFGAGKIIIKPDFGRIFITFNEVAHAMLFKLRWTPN